MGSQAEQQSFTIRPSVGGMAFGAVGAVVLVVFGASLMGGGGVSLVLAVVAFVMAPVLIGETVLSFARTEGEVLLVANGLRRVRFHRSDILTFDIPVTFIKGGNAITVLPKSGRPTRINASGRSMSAFSEIAPMGVRLNAWLHDDG